MIEVRLARVVVREGGEQQSIALQERGGERSFPIIIRTQEAREIRRVVTGEATPRPFTHQLTHAVIEGMGGQLLRVDVVDLRDNTFFAELIVGTPDGEEVAIDARPSDALALGLRAGCPLRVAESVLEQARTDSSGPDPQP